MPDTGEVLVRHKLDLDTYYRMINAGIFGKEDRIELIEGELIDMAPIGDDHCTSVDVLTETLVLACTRRAIVSVQLPIRLNRFNAPQPDFTVSRLRADRYRTGRPGPADILLLVEVSDSSLRFDRTVKLPLYAQAGIAEVWIVDLQRRAFDVHRAPADGSYAELTTYGPADSIALALAPDITISLSGVLD